MMSDMMKLIIVSLGATLLRNIQKEPEQDIVLFVETGNHTYFECTKCEVHLLSKCFGASHGKDRI